MDVLGDLGDEAAALPLVRSEGDAVGGVVAVALSTQVVPEGSKPGRQMPHTDDVAPQGFLFAAADAALAAVSQAAAAQTPAAHVE